MTLTEIRSLKTHGPKRMRVLLEVFYAVQSLIADCSAQPHLTVRILPRFASGLERWVRAAFKEVRPPKQSAVKQHLTEPLLEQVRVDLGDVVGHLAAALITSETVLPLTTHQQVG